MMKQTSFVAGWAAVSVVAETVAVSVAFVAGATTWSAVLAVIVLEALLLGLGQRWILRRAHDGLERNWLPATIAGALLGRVAEYVADTSALSATIGALAPAARVGFGAALGLLVGALMGAPQAFALARRVDRSWLWIGVRAVAWAIALPLLLLPGASIARFSSAGAGTIAVTILAEFAIVAAFVGIAEGLALERLIHPVPSRRTFASIHQSRRPST